MVNSVGVLLSALPVLRNAAYLRCENFHVPFLFSLHRSAEPAAGCAGLLTVGHHVSGLTAGGGRQPVVCRVEVRRDTVVAV